MSCPGTPEVGAIDPLEAVIAWLFANANINALTNGRIAPRQKFGDDGPRKAAWQRGRAAVQVRYDGGSGDLYLANQRVRLEFRLYGGSFHECSTLYMTLVAASRRCQRQVVETTNGKALVYWLNLVSGPSFLRDPDCEMDMVLVYAETNVSEIAVN